MSEYPTMLEVLFSEELGFQAGVFLGLFLGAVGSFLVVQLGAFGGKQTQRRSREEMEEIIGERFAEEKARAREETQALSSREELRGEVEEIVRVRLVEEKSRAREEAEARSLRE